MKKFVAIILYIVIGLILFAGLLFLFASISSNPDSGNIGFLPAIIAAFSTKFIVPLIINKIF